MVWDKFTWDIILILLIGSATFISGFIIRRKSIPAMIMSGYVALAVVSSLPFLNAGEATIWTALLKIAAFIVSFTLVYFSFHHKKMIKPDLVKSALPAMIINILFAVLFAGFAVRAIFAFLPPSTIEQQLSQFTKTIFLSQLAQTIWTIAPIVVIFFVVLRERSRVAASGEPEQGVQEEYFDEEGEAL